MYVKTRAKTPITVLLLLNIVNKQVTVYYFAERNFNIQQVTTANRDNKLQSSQLLIIR